MSEIKGALSLAVVEIALRGEQYSAREWVLRNREVASMGWGGNGGY